MEGLDDLLEKEDLLFRARQYDLYRTDSTGKSSRLIILVTEGLNGADKGKFYATPSVMVRYAKSEYVGRGTTEEEALRDSLRKMKGVSVEEILEEL